jgi:hypothetical protein
MRALILLLILLLAFGCGTRKDWDEPTKKSEPAPVADDKPEPKKNPKPQNYHEYIKQLAREVPIEVAALKKSSYKSRVISYEVHPNDPDSFLFLTISIKPVYPSDDIIAPRWFNKAVLVSNMAVRSGGVTSMESAIQSAQMSALNSDGFGWGSVGMLP